MIGLAWLLVIPIGLIGLEIALRIGWYNPHHFYVRTPGTLIIRDNSSSGLRGASLRPVIATNKLGLRGGLPGRAKVRMLAVGGSTTECALLDHHKTWPHQLQVKSSRAWVGNAGKAGNNCHHHLVALQKILPQLPKLDRVLILPGLTDMLFDFQIHYPAGLGKDWIEHEAFRYRPAQKQGMWRFWTPHFLRHVFNGIAGRYPPGYRVSTSPKISDYKIRRGRVKADDFITEVPNMDLALAAFRKNLTALCDLIARHGAVPILLTHPSIWHANASDEVNGQLYAGGIGSPDTWDENPNTKWYAADTLARMLKAYNDAVLALCRDLDIQCIDLEAATPKTPALFVDDFHFSEAGAEFVASVIARDIGQPCHGNAMMKS